MRHPVITAYIPRAEWKAIRLLFIGFFACMLHAHAQSCSVLTGVGKGEAYGIEDTPASDVDFPASGVETAESARAEIHKGEEDTANPASLQTRELMHKVFAFGSYSTLEQVQYNSHVYLRHRMYTRRKGPFMRYIPGMLRLDHGTHSYLSEAEMNLAFRPGENLDCKVVAFHTTAPYLSPNRFHDIGRFNFQIYDSKLFIDALLNPLHRRNRHFYHYRFLYATPADKALGKPAIARIRIRPRFANDQLASGYINMDMESGHVVSFLFTFRYQFSHITLSGRLGQSGYDRMVPQRLRVISDCHILGNRVYEVTELHSRNSFTCPLTDRQKPSRDRYDLTEYCRLRIDTTRVIISSAYFDSIRSMPLRTEEQTLLERYLAGDKDSGDEQSAAFVSLPSDSLHNSAPRLPNPTEGLSGDTLNRRAERSWKQDTQDLLLDSHAFKLSRNGRFSIKLPPVFTPSMVQWSHTRGVALRTRLHFLLAGKDRRSEPMMSFSPSVGYSFKQKQVYWQLPYKLRFAPKLSGQLTAEAGGGAHNYNNRQARELRQKLEGIEDLDTLIHIIDHFGFHDYRDQYAKTDLSLSPHPDWSFTLGARYHRRTLIDWNEVSEATGFLHYFTTLGPHAELHWTPAQRYYREGGRRIPLYSPLPSFLLTYERGYNLGKGSTGYEKIETDIHYRLPLYAMRTLYFRAGAGFYTIRGKDCFLDYDYFRFNYMPEGWNDELMGEFQTLSARWYNESRYYVRLSSGYESPMLLLSRLPLASRVIQKERIYLNLLSVHALGLYTEAGYGISTRLLDLGFFSGMGMHRTFRFGFRVVVNIFDD